jgi:2-phospho-L-lactate guanylyltransferase
MRDRLDNRLNMAIVIPVKGFSASKSRLSPLLTHIQRVRISKLMLKFTLKILSQLHFETRIVVVSYDEHVHRIADAFGVDFVYEKKKGVNAAVQAADRFCIENGIQSNIIIPTDLCFLNVHDVNLVYYQSMKFQNVVVICPSLKKDGTNLLLRNPIPLIETSFDNTSYYNHLKSAIKSKAHVILIDSPTLARDIDTTHDMIAAIDLNPKSMMTAKLDAMLSKLQV